MRDKALKQLHCWGSLTGKNGAFAHLLKEFLETALAGESAHLYSKERSEGNKRNKKGCKHVKTFAGEIKTPQDRQSSFTPEIIRKRKTIDTKSYVFTCEILIYLLYLWVILF